MPPKLKPSGQVIQQNEDILGSDEAPTNSAPSPGLTIKYVDGKNPEVRKIPVMNNAPDLATPEGSD